jgi:hypothetical protein
MRSGTQCSTLTLPVDDVTAVTSHDRVTAALTLSRPQILAFRRQVGALNARLPHTAQSLRTAAWAGLQDSMPRAALLSLHARVSDIGPDILDDPSLAQVWGLRYSNYVIAGEDRAIFTLGRYPDDTKGQARAESVAAQLRDHLGGARKTYGEVGEALGINPNALRYGTTTGTILIRWDGARAALVWSVPPPTISAAEAQAELARRHLHIFGPSTPQSFSDWAGISVKAATSTFAALAAELLPAETPIGSAWILAADEPLLRQEPADETAHRPATEPVLVRLLPSGDAYYLLQGRERELLLPDPQQRAELWTSRVWPGAVMLDGEIRGTWRRANATFTFQMWRTPSAAQRSAVEAEAASLPLPGLTGQIRTRWE